MATKPRDRLEQEWAARDLHTQRLAWLCLLLMFAALFAVAVAR